MAFPLYINDVDEAFHNQDDQSLGIEIPPHVKWAMIARQETYFAALVAEEVIRNHATKPEIQQLISTHFAPCYDAESVLFLLQSMYKLHVLTTSLMERAVTELTSRANWKCSIDCMIVCDWNEEELDVPQPAADEGVMIRFTCIDRVELADDEDEWPVARSDGRTITFDREDYEEACDQEETDWDKESTFRQLHDDVYDIEYLEYYYDALMVDGDACTVYFHQETLYHLMLREICRTSLAGLEYETEERRPLFSMFDPDKLSTFIIAVFLTVRFPGLSFCGRCLEIRPRDEPATSHPALEDVFKERILEREDPIFSEHDEDEDWDFAFELLWKDGSWEYYKRVDGPDAPLRGVSRYRLDSEEWEALTYTDSRSSKVGERATR
ncbi:hypothetical protein LTR10_017306 [Elasticomyces elasticus]|uniref:Uncharacterized protein n=1 Tax=Exophiala sideris TaxID=1016849 RepID=A0ABR0JHR3_9EURO|nr:hypothetical protein LTR10_017306 [Elasticomyces elasticus]KAK5034133.1 hypothetical protein LTS07_003053 [Exophiala sideris]KAK5042429.1 hypothetical protein LTR13_001276 [Exophiala sideris]KAK5065511.1 hypothetical protein LTR69_003060 [Exophiala sideris]KAK5186030.1 hypothetical protein LTR44_002079 [Eurotiomycetes sp. CCFEE 6388]